MHSAQCPVCSVSGIVKSPFVRLRACSALVASGSPPPCDNMTDLTDFFSHFFAHNLSCYCTCHTCMLGMIHTEMSPCHNFMSWYNTSHICYMYVTQSFTQMPLQVTILASCSTCALYPSSKASRHLVDVHSHWQ